MSNISFENYIRGILSADDFDNLTALLGTSPHRKTKILNDPTIMTNTEVLILSAQLNVQPIDLVVLHNAGKEVLTDIEKRIMHAMKKGVLSAAKLAA